MRNECRNAANEEEKKTKKRGRGDGKNIAIPQGYQNKLQYLLPICLTNMKKPDLAMTLSVMDGYYLGNTCLTLEMAYLNARVIARPTAIWLTDLVK
jgi:hypothetical protein